MIPQLIRKWNARREYISAGFTGRFHLFENAGFSALSACMVLIGILQLRPMGFFPMLLAFIIAGALTMTQVSDTWSGLIGRDWHSVHIGAAATSFVTAGLLELAICLHWHHGWLWAMFGLSAAPAAIVKFLWPSDGPWIEKAGTAGVVAFFTAFIAGIPLPH